MGFPSPLAAFWGEIELLKLRLEAVPHLCQRSAPEHLAVDFWQFSGMWRKVSLRAEANLTAYEDART